MTSRSVMAPDGNGDVLELLGVRGVEIMIRIECMENIFNKRKMQKE